jgi:hypothetical protein
MVDSNLILNENNFPGMAAPKNGEHCPFLSAHKKGHLRPESNLALRMLATAAILHDPTQKKSVFTGHGRKRSPSTLPQDPIAPNKILLLFTDFFWLFFRCFPCYVLTYTIICIHCIY